MGIHVRRAVAVLHEEALVVLEPARHAHVEAVGVVVVEHLANTRCLKLVAATTSR
jgi:DNA-binding GntR family transcriptional regulator